jgi:hypothetical protein
MGFSLLHTGCNEDSPQITEAVLVDGVPNAESVNGCTYVVDVDGLLH